MRRPSRNAAARHPKIMKAGSVVCVFRTQADFQNKASSRAERTQRRGRSPDQDERYNRAERTQCATSSESPYCFAAPRSRKGRLSRQLNSACRANPTLSRRANPTSERKSRARRWKWRRRANPLPGWKARWGRGDSTSSPGAWAVGPGTRRRASGHPARSRRGWSFRLIFDSTK